MTEPMAVLSCCDVAPVVIDYLEHTLEPGSRAELEAHLAVCDACVAYLRDYEQTVRLARSAFEDAAATDARAPRRLVDAILAARGRRS